MGNNKKIGNNAMEINVKNKPKIITINLAINPKTLENKLKTTLSIKEKSWSPPLTVSLCHGANKVLNKSEIEKALKTYETKFLQDCMPGCMLIFYHSQNQQKRTPLDSLLFLFIFSRN